MSTHENETTSYSVFDKMLDHDMVAAFLRRKEASYNVSSEEYIKLNAYLTSPDYY